MTDYKIISAPGQYKLERSATVILGHSPKFSFGLKTQVEKQSDTPGKIIQKPTDNIFHFLTFSSIILTGAILYAEDAPIPVSNKMDTYYS